MNSREGHPDQRTALGEEPKRRWLRARQTLIAGEMRRWRGRESAWSWARLAVFVAGAWVWVALGEGALARGTIALGSALMFAVAVWRHLRAKRHGDFLRRELLVMEESQRRLGGQVALIRSWQRPADADDLSPLEPIFPPGPTWALTDQEREDLDLFAPPVGVFGLLNRTSTAPGARRLRDWMDRPLLSDDRILSRQECVRWLARHGAERLEMMAAAAGLRGQDDWLDRLHRAVLGARPIGWRAACRLLRVGSVFTGAFALVAAGRLLIGRAEWFVPLLAALAINAVPVVILRRRLRAILRAWQDLAATCRRLLSAARCAARRLPEEGELGALRKCFEAAADPPVLPSLSRRVAWAGSGGPIHELVNLVCLYDLHVADAILARAVPHRESLLRALSALADLEALAGLSCFAWEQPAACWPRPLDGPKRELGVVAGRHPLIPPDRAVPNDVSLSPRTSVWVVTGPNTAGKSTLLRMVGVNVLLAQWGAAACAREMTFSPLRLTTDLCARDSLAKEESYFLSEVRHLRRMLFPPADGAPTLGLIDEPFRGTNSREKRAAGLALVEHLAGAADLFLVATHDDALTGLADALATVENRHFRERVQPDGVVFDYRLRPGPATTTTAIQILQHEKYPEDLIARARELLAEITQPKKAGRDAGE